MIFFLDCRHCFYYLLISERGYLFAKVFIYYLGLSEICWVNYFISYCYQHKYLLLWLDLIFQFALFLYLDVDFLIFICLLLIIFSYHIFPRLIPSNKWCCLVHAYLRRQKITYLEAYSFYLVFGVIFPMVSMFLNSYSLYSTWILMEYSQYFGPSRSIFKLAI